MVLSVGDNELPCGTPESNCINGPIWDPITIFALLLVMKLKRSLVVVSGRSRCSNVYLRPSCHTLSKVLETSRKTM